MSAENIRILNTTKELPNNIEAEQIILGSILVNNEIFDEISIIVNENIFFDPIHQKIFHYLNRITCCQRYGRSYYLLLDQRERKAASFLPYRLRLYQRWLCFQQTRGDYKN